MKVIFGFTRNKDTKRKNVFQNMYIMKKGRKYVASQRHSKDKVIVPKIVLILQKVLLHKYMYKKYEEDPRTNLCILLNKQIKVKYNFLNEVTMVVKHSMILQTNTVCLLKRLLSGK